MDKTYLIELVRDVPPLWDQRDKNYHNRDLKPNLWDETGEKLNITGKVKKLKVACGAFSALQPVGRLYPCPQ